MKKPLLVIGLLAAIIYAWKQPAKTPVQHLLASNTFFPMVFDIDITKEHTLIANGVLIQIPAGALSSNDSIVELEIKEAHTMRDMLNAGLTTTSNGQPLSSGGMIYINAVGGKPVKFNKPISVAIPTPFIERRMNLYKGAIQDDSTINWVDPKRLGANPQLAAMDNGQIFFNENCGNCHTLGKDLISPDLAHILKRTPAYAYEAQGISDLYSFTRNPARAIYYDKYYHCLQNKYSGVVMTAFPNLTDSSLDYIYSYIENESERRHLPVPDNGIIKCRDSCELYVQATTHWKEVKAKLEKEAVDMVEYEKKYPDTGIKLPSAVYSSQIPGWDDTKIVTPNMHKSLYYQFTIESFGWYNVDVLTKNLEGVEPSELMVHIQNGDKERIAVY